MPDLSHLIACWQLQGSKDFLENKVIFGIEVPHLARVADSPGLVKMPIRALWEHLLEPQGRAWLHQSREPLEQPVQGLPPELLPQPELGRE